MTRDSRPRRGIGWVGALLWLMIVSLLVVNLWLTWTRRPVPEFSEVLQTLQSGREDEAVRLLDHLLARSPHHGDALMLRASLDQARGEPIRAASRLEQVPDWYPNKKAALALEGQIWIEAGYARRAERAWSAYLQDDPNHPVERPRLGDVEGQLLNLYQIQNRIDEMRDQIWNSYQRSQGVLDAQREAMVMSFRTLIETERPSAKEGVEVLSRYVEADPEDWRSRVPLAMAWDYLARTAPDPDEAKTQFAQADRHLQIALKQHPDEPLIQQARLEMLSHRDQIDAMGPIFREVPDDALDTPRCLYFRGVWLQEQGDFEGAEKAFTRVVQREPDDPPALFRLFRIRKRLGKDREAREPIERHRRIVEAQGELTPVFNQYIDALNAPGSERQERLAAVLRRMSELFEVLGLTREADGVARLVPETSHDSHPSMDGHEDEIARIP